MLTDQLSSAVRGSRWLREGSTRARVHDTRCSDPLVAHALAHRPRSPTPRGSRTQCSEPRAHQASHRRPAVCVRKIIPGRDDSRPAPAPSAQVRLRSSPTCTDYRWRPVRCRRVTPSPQRERSAHPPHAASNVALCLQHEGVRRSLAPHYRRGVPAGDAAQDHNVIIRRRSPPLATSRRVAGSCSSETTN